MKTSCQSIGVGGRRAILDEMTKDPPFEALGELDNKLRGSLSVHGRVSADIQGAAPDMPVQFIFSFLLLAIKEPGPGDLSFSRGNEPGLVGGSDFRI